MQVVHRELENKYDVIKIWYDRVEEKVTVIIKSIETGKFYYGRAICGKRDIYVKKLGRKIALGRAEKAINSLADVFSTLKDIPRSCNSCVVENLPEREKGEKSEKEIKI